MWPSRFRREEMQVLLTCGDLWRMRRSLAWCRVLALALAFAEPPLPHRVAKRNPPKALIRMPPNPSARRTCRRPLRALGPAAGVER